MPGPDLAPRVVIAGGGFAAAETALALRAIAGDRVDLHMVAPNTDLAFRPAATAEPFADVEPLRFSLGALARDVDMTLHRSTVAAVAPAAQRVRLAHHGRLDYEFLVLAMGGRLQVAVPGATTFRDQRDSWRVRNALTELWAQPGRRIAFAVPSGCSWPLPIYELAMLTAQESIVHGLEAEIVLATPERVPLEAFGGEASGAVADRLRELGVRFMGSAAPVELRRTGGLLLRSGETVAADAAIAAPRVVGPQVSGIPGSFSGFVPTDSRGRVEGLHRVWAAGDLTTFPIKQGGLAAQQADDVAQQIAETVGAPVAGRRGERELRARLIAGDITLILRARLDDRGRAHGATAVWGATGDDVAERKVFSRYLTPYLEARAPVAA